MPTRLITVLLLALTASQALAQGEGFPTAEERRAMLAHLEPYTGRWVGSLVGEETEFAEAYEYPTEWEGMFILGGEAFMFRGVTVVEGEPVEFCSIIAYDMATGGYRNWVCQSGGFYFTADIDWAEDGSGYTVTPELPEDAEYSVVMQVDLENDRLSRYGTRVTADDGTLLVNMNATARPEPGEIAYLERDERAPVDDPLAMMRPYASGHWVSEVRGAETDFIDEPYEASGEWASGEMLGGELIVAEGVAGAAGQEYRYLWIYAYDPALESYVGWYHDENGVHTYMLGTYSQEDRAMTMTSCEEDQQNMGVVSTFVDHHVDEDTLEFSFQLETLDGAVIYEETGTARRVVE